MREKVILDTNIVRNAEINNFLGGRSELERFLQDADIVIPKTVIEEIRRQKRQSLFTNKNKFISNPLHELMGLDKKKTKAFDIDAYIQKLINDETIPFKVIDIKDNNVLPKMAELAIRKQAPFEKGENTDKGFKDALIYFSILEYLQEIPNKKVFVCAKDKRLQDALNRHHNIIVVESYEEFKQNSVSQFFDDYFIEKVNTELGATITKENIIEYWHNIDDNQNVLIQIGEAEYIVEVDAGEIVGSSEKAFYQEYIKQLILSRNFEMTHNTIEELTPFINYLSDDEIMSLLNASFSNQQINWIIEDDDVKEFIGTLYKSKYKLVEGETADFLKDIFE